MSDNQAEAPGAQQPIARECFCMGLGPELYALLKRLNPDTARQHFRTAKIEFLKGIRAIIDRRIEELSQQQASKGTRISVE